MAYDFTVTVTINDGDCFVDATRDDDDDVTTLEAVGALEIAKAILLGSETVE